MSLFIRINTVISQLRYRQKLSSDISRVGETRAREIVFFKMSFCITKIFFKAIEPLIRYTKSSFFRGKKKQQVNIQVSNENTYAYTMNPRLSEDFKNTRAKGITPSK